MSTRGARFWSGMGTKFLPFADAATKELPLGRLLRLSLFQVSVGMAAVLLTGTLNRVMIVELGVPASLVGIMLSLPLLFAPFRALIGFKSDTHVSAIGWRRVPYLFQGTMLQFGGLAIMPFALLVLAGAGMAHATADAMESDDEVERAGLRRKEEMKGVILQAGFNAEHGTGGEEASETEGARLDGGGEGLVDLDAVVVFVSRQCEVQDLFEKHILSLLRDEAEVAAVG